MAKLALAGLSEDGRRLLLVDDGGAEFTLDVTPQLRAALRGDHTRIGQLEIQMDSALRPRDIQARIRAGETPEAVAQAAQTTVEKIMPFAMPVLAEREHVATRAQDSSLRRRSGESGARTLGEAVAFNLRAVGAHAEDVEWDAWRREDNRWTLVGRFRTPKRKGTATFALDLRGNFVTSEDDDARWLVGDLAEEPEAGSRPAPTGTADLQQARGRRLSAVPAEELPLGEDAIELVHDSAEATADDSNEASPTETTLDLTRELRQDEEAPSEDKDVADDTPEEPSPQVPEDGPAEEQPTRRQVRKNRGRASVPSWDEIMFGGGSGDK